MGPEELKTTAEVLPGNHPSSASEEPKAFGETKAQEETSPITNDSDENSPAEVPAIQDDPGTGSGTGKPAPDSAGNNPENTAKEPSGLTPDPAQPEEGNNNLVDSSAEPEALPSEDKMTEEAKEDVLQEDAAPQEKDPAPEGADAEKEDETSAKQAEEPAKDTGSATRDTTSAEKAEDREDNTPEKNSSSHRGLLYALLGVLLAVLAFLIWQRFIQPRMQSRQTTETAASTLPDRNEPVRQTQETPGLATVSGSNTPETVKQPETPREKQTEPATQKKQQTEKETQKKGTELDRVVFGEQKNTAGLATIKVTGLTDADKANTNFKEAAFVKAAASFLADNRISVNTISFFGRNQSSGRSFSYQARLGGNTDRILVVTMYPAIPGEYVFNLVSLKDIKNQYKLSETQPQTTVQPQTAAQPQTTAQAQPQTATPVQQPSSQIFEEQTPNETIPENTSTNSYDASSFYVSNIPTTLSNYMNNPDILQYRLYDFLYQSGIRSEAGASVSGYDINEDARTATIDISLNGGGSVRCYYDKDSDQYSFQ